MAASTGFYLIATAIPGLAGAAIPSEANRKGPVVRRPVQLVPSSKCENEVQKQGEKSAKMARVNT
jgi:hypothetical protein